MRWQTEQPNIIFSSFLYQVCICVAQMSVKNKDIDINITKNQLYNTTILTIAIDERQKNISEPVHHSGGFHPARITDGENCPTSVYFDI
jgi:hypothetical protein